MLSRLSVIGLMTETLFLCLLHVIARQNWFLLVLQRKNIDNELILDSDLYQSDNRILSLGKGMMDGDTLPVKYSKEQWKAIKKRLDFPETELTGSPLVSTDVSGNQFLDI